MRHASCHRLLGLALVLAGAAAPSVAAPIAVAALLEGTPPSGLIDNASFLPSSHPRHAHERFQGALRLDEHVMTTQPADLGPHAVLGKDPQFFPAVTLTFTTVDGDLVPATEEVIRVGSLPGGHSYWDIIVQPGQVWSEPRDHGWSRAAFPFSLVHTLEGETHHGIATFLYQGKRVSAVRYQIVQQTTPGHIETYFTAAGVAPAHFEAARNADFAALAREHRAVLRDAIVIKPWSDLERQVGAATLAGFADGLADRETVLTGLDFHGVFYRRECTSAAGPLPWCERTRFGIWSVTKAFANEVALLRLAQKYGPSVFTLKIRDYVPEVAAVKAWENVRFDDCINMATGLGNGSPLREPNDASDGYIDATYNEWADARSRAEKVSALLRIAKVYPWRPGKVTRYRDQDMFLLGEAMDRFLKSKEGPSADLWSMMEREVYRPIGIHHAPINHTIEPDGGRGLAMTAYGYYATLDDLVKVARLYHSRGQHHGRQLLYAPRIDELRAGTTPRGLPTGVHRPAGETTYFNAFWQMRYDATEGCHLYIPQMEGWGENLVGLFPGGLTGVRIAHNPAGAPSAKGDPLAMVRVANRLVRFCE